MVQNLQRRIKLEIVEVLHANNPKIRMRYICLSGFFGGRNGEILNDIDITFDQGLGKESKL